MMLIALMVGWVIHEIAKGKPVRGLILSHKDDLALEYAVSANPNLSLRYFRLKFDLLPAKGILGKNACLEKSARSAPSVFQRRRRGIFVASKTKPISSSVGAAYSVRLPDDAAPDGAEKSSV
jgi:hypothetical protein